MGNGEVTWPRYEADHSHQTTAEVKKYAGIMHSTMRFITVKLSGHTLLNKINKTYTL